MPFESRAQQRWGHTQEGIKALGGKTAVAEWDRETKGKKIPERKTPEKRKPAKFGSLG
jgi:hypothetical protein